MTTPLPALRFAKGHGTENDFVLVPDASGELDLSPEQVAALCDRRTGIGGDGLIRAVPAAAVDEAKGVFGPEVVWFMDYRNSDGSVAEMCGNGLRVFVAYLEHLGLIRVEDEIAIGTRAGTKRVRRDGELFAADLGMWRLVGAEPASAAGFDARVSIAGEQPDLPGLSIDVGNPHVVVALPDLDRLSAADLRTAPDVVPPPPEGTNVELVVPLRPASATEGHLVMRVFERGVGETRSCGTGAVAAVLAARAWAGTGAPDRWWVDVPGGRLRVTVPAGAFVAGESVELAGPAVIVAEGGLVSAEGAPDA